MRSQSEFCLILSDRGKILVNTATKAQSSQLHIQHLIDFIVAFHVFTTETNPLSICSLYDWTIITAARNSILVSIITKRQTSFDNYVLVAWQILNAFLLLFPRRIDLIVEEDMKSIGESSYDAQSAETVDSEEASNIHHGTMKPFLPFADHYIKPLVIVPVEFDMLWFGSFFGGLRRLSIEMDSDVTVRFLTLLLSNGECLLFTVPQKQYSSLELFSDTLSRFSSPQDFSISSFVPSEEKAQLVTLSNMLLWNEVFLQDMLPTSSSSSSSPSSTTSLPSESPDAPKSPTPFLIVFPSELQPRTPGNLFLIYPIPSLGASLLLCFIDPEVRNTLSVSLLSTLPPLHHSPIAYLTRIISQTVSPIRSLTVSDSPSTHSQLDSSPSFSPPIPVSLPPHLRLLTHHFTHVVSLIDSTFPHSPFHPSLSGFHSDICSSTPITSHTLSSHPTHPPLSHPLPLSSYIPHKLSDSSQQLNTPRSFSPQPALQASTRSSLRKFSIHRHDPQFGPSFSAYSSSSSSSLFSSAQTSLGSDQLTMRADENRVEDVTRNPEYTPFSKFSRASSSLSFIGSHPSFPQTAHGPSRPRPKGSVSEFGTSGF